MHYKEIRARGRQNLGGSLVHTDWQTAVGICLVAALICAIPILSLFLIGPVCYGLAFAFLKKARGSERFAFGDLFSGFNIWKDTMILGLIRWMIPFFWFALPALGALAFQWLFGKAMIFLELTGTFQLIYFIVQAICTAVGIMKYYSYALAMYVRVDNPSASWQECMGHSAVMMHGHRVELFWLELSFFGWIVLGILLFGVGLFWVVPYMTASLTNYYEERRTHDARMLDEMEKEIQRGATTPFDELGEERRSEDEREPNPVAEYFEARRAASAREFNEQMDSSHRLLFQGTGRRRHRGYEVKSDYESESDQAAQILSEWNERVRKARLGNGTEAPDDRPAAHGDRSLNGIQFPPLSDYDREASRRTRGLVRILFLILIVAAIGAALIFLNWKAGKKTETTKQPPLPERTEYYHTLRSGGRVYYVMDQEYQGEMKLQKILFLQGTPGDDASEERSYYVLEDGVLPTGFDFEGVLDRDGYLRFCRKWGMTPVYPNHDGNYALRAHLIRNAMDVKVRVGDAIVYDHTLWLLASSVDTPDYNYSIGYVVTIPVSKDVTGMQTLPLCDKHTEKIVQQYGQVELTVDR